MFSLAPRSLAAWEVEWGPTLQIYPVLVFSLFYSTSAAEPRDLAEPEPHARSSASDSQTPHSPAHILSTIQKTVHLVALSCNSVCLIHSFSVVLYQSRIKNCNKNPGMLLFQKTTKDTHKKKHTKKLHKVCTTFVTLPESPGFYSCSCFFYSVSIPEPFMP